MSGSSSLSQMKMEITYYFPWGYFYPVLSGTALVASRHLEYFRSRGAKTRIVLLGDDTARERQAFEKHYQWVQSVHVFNSARHPHIQQLCDERNLDAVLMAHSDMCEVPEFRAALARPADIFFTNYVFSATLLDAVSPKAKSILESHDLLSKQVLWGDKPPLVREHQLQSEFELYSIFDSVIMINHEETILARRRGVQNAVYIPQAVDVAPSDIPFEHPSGGAYDLLFVGSGHMPNIHGVARFYETVFRPFLEPLGLRWAIAGSVCDSLTFQDASVLPLGRVEDLSNTYRQAKVVVVPLFSGAGISIKTLEAMGQGKAIVTTPCGVRGLDGCEEALVKLDFEAEPREVARRIVELCRARMLRENYGRRAMAYIKEHFDKSMYAKNMDALIEGLVPGITQSAVPRAA